ncbi:MAG: hypothetical protein Q4D38_09510 [Planctomycetia bacterium]|nr:hypothetical protein [Planctomycetia bacterium]
MNDKTEALENGNVSELEMVGEMLFGSIGVAEDAAKSSSENGMVNLGAKIAPATERTWNPDEEEVGLVSRNLQGDSIDSRGATQDITPMTTPIVPATVEPAQVSDVESASTPKPQREGKKQGRARRYFVAAGGYVISVLVLGAFYLGCSFHQEAEESPEAASSVETPPALVSTPAPTTTATAPSAIFDAEAISVPTQINTTIDNNTSVETDFPTFNAEFAGFNASAPMAEEAIAPSVGASAATLPQAEESYPTFNAELCAAPMSAPAPAAYSAPATNSAPAAYAAPEFSQAPPACDPYAVVSMESLNAGASMDEVPVFNNPYAANNQQASTSVPTYTPNYAPNHTTPNYAPTYAATNPVYAPSSPAVGTQAGVGGFGTTAPTGVYPTTLQTPAAAPSVPRKLTPPHSAASQDTLNQDYSNAPTQGSAATYPAFDSQAGGSGMLPTTYR